MAHSLDLASYNRQGKMFVAANTASKNVIAVTTAMISPPRVAPTSGMRSKNAISTASGTANGTFRISSVTYVMSPAITLIVRLPNT